MLAKSNLRGKINEAQLLDLNKTVKDTKYNKVFEVKIDLLDEKISVIKPVTFLGFFGSPQNSLHFGKAFSSVLVV